MAVSRPWAPTACKLGGRLPRAATVKKQPCGHSHRDTERSNISTRFAVIDFYAYLQPDGYIFEFITDCACHLTMRYTGYPPDKHMEWVKRRGLDMHSNPRWCFVGYKEIEQQEEGDTLWHSFYPKDTTTWNHIYIYLIGTIAGIPSPSTSAIMDFPLEIWDANWYWEERGLIATGMALSYNNPLAMVFKLDEPWHIKGVQIYCYGTNRKHHIHININECNFWGRPTGPPLLSSELMQTPYKIIFPEKRKFFFPLADIILQSNKKYAICIYGDPAFPDDTVLWWSASPEAYAYHDERSYSGYRVGGFVSWFKNPQHVLYYRLWDDVGYYPPGQYHPRQSLYIASIYPGETPVLWWEAWSPLLTESNPWEQFGFPSPPLITYQSGILELKNFGVWDCGILVYQAQPILPLINEAGRHLVFHCNNTEATANSNSSINTHEFILKKGTDAFTIYLPVAKGSDWEDEFWSKVAVPPMGSRFIGTGAHEVDMCDLFQYFMEKLELDPNPAGWVIGDVAITLGTHDPDTVDWIKSDYLGFNFN